MVKSVFLFLGYISIYLNGVDILPVRQRSTNNRGVGGWLKGTR